MDETMTNETIAEPTPTPDVEQAQDEPENLTIEQLWPLIIEDVKYRSLDADRILGCATGLRVSKDGVRLDVDLVDRGHIVSSLLGQREQDIIRTAIHNRAGFPEIMLNVHPETIELPLDEYHRLAELDYCFKRIAQLMGVEVDES